MADDDSSGTGSAEVVVAPATPAIVVHGNATSEQLAALVAVLSTASSRDQPASEPSGSAWAAHSVALRQPLSHGPGAWRTSLRG